MPDIFDLRPDQGAGIAIGIIVLFAALLWLWARRAGKRDKELFRQIEPLLEELWDPMRYMADLKSVWPDLTEAQRAEIEASSVHKEQFHERKAENLTEQIFGLAKGVRSFNHWRLRAVLLAFLKNWDDQEPDNLKVLLSMVRRQGQK